MKKFHKRGTNKVTYKLTAFKTANKIKQFLNANFNTLKYLIYQKGQKGVPPQGVYYTFKTGYSDSYVKKKAKEGIELNKHNYYTVVSEVYPTIGNIKNEVVKLIEDYQNDFSDFSELDNLYGSDFENEPSRIVSVTISIVHKQ